MGCALHMVCMHTPKKCKFLHTPFCTPKFGVCIAHGVQLAPARQGNKLMMLTTLFVGIVTANATATTISGEKKKQIHNDETAMHLHRNDWTG